MTGRRGATRPGRPVAAIALLLGAAVAATAGCGSGDGGDEGARCGPASATVKRVIDGDTIELEGGQRVRYLGVDAPENTRKTECFGPQATAFNRGLVEGKRVGLEYDQACKDCYGRLLAHVVVGGRRVGRTLLERGLGCLLVIPPNGAHTDDFRAAEKSARAAGRGLWGSCSPRPCASRVLKTAPRCR